MILLALLISPIAEYVIEKNAKAWTGRIIRMEDLDINLFSGALSIQGLEMLEADDKTPFLTCQSFQTRVKIFPAINGNFVIPGTTIHGLNVLIEQQGDHFNFDDLIARFASADTTADPDSETTPTPFTLQNFRLKDATITYRMPKEKIEIPVKNLELALTEFCHDSKTLDLQYGFEFATGGKFSGEWLQHMQSNDYTVAMLCEGFDLKMLEQFLTPYIALHSFTGKINADFLVAGNLDSSENVTAKGSLQLQNLAMLDPLQQPLMKTGLFDMQIDSVNTASNYYNIDHIQLDNLYLRYELYENGDNWTRLMEPDTNSTEEIDTLDYTNPFKVLAIYMDLMLKEYSVSQFYAKNIAMNNAEIFYTDHSLPEPFDFIIDQCYMTVNDLNTTTDRIKMNAEMRLNRAGNATAMCSVNPHNAMDMDLEWKVSKFPFSSFNPYMTYYVGYPFTKGDAEYQSTNSIRNGMLNSSNHFVLMNPQVGSLVPNAQYKVPMKLAVSLLRNPKGNIDLNIPIEGDLNDPEYKVRKAAWKIVGNIVTKAVTAPYNLIAKAAGGGAELEDLSDFALKNTSANLNDKQKQRVKKVVKGLLAKPELFVTLTQEYDSIVEIEELGTVEARRRYAREKGIIVAGDSVASDVAMIIDSISTKDTLFVQWLLSKTNNNVESNIDKCIRLIGRDELTVLQQRLVLQRQINLVAELDKLEVPRYRYTFTENRSKQLPPGTQPRFSYTVGEYPPGHPTE